jgi:cyanophycinase-like exopeptidase
MPEQLESRRLLAVYDAFAVSALGSTATSSRILEDGVSYSVNISGFVLVQNSEKRVSDAEYFEIWDAVNKRKTGQWADVSSTSGLDVGVRLSQVAGAGKWGPRNPAGVYSQSVVGTGTPLQARFIDSPYTDNSGSFSVTISQNIPVSVAAVDATAKEENQDPGTFRISRGGSTRYALPVTFSLTGTSSDGAADYTISHTGSVTIPAGQSFIDVTLTPVDDKNVEFGEAVTLTLQAASQYDLVPGATAAVVKIEDNDLVVDLDTDSNNDGVIDPDNSPAGTDDPIEENQPGRVLALNDDDDDADNVSDMAAPARVVGENDLAELRLSVSSVPVTGPGQAIVTITASAGLRLWSDASRSVALAANNGIASWDLFVSQPPVSLFVEGVAVGGATLVCMLAGERLGIHYVTDTVALLVRENEPPELADPTLDFQLPKLLSWQEFPLFTQNDALDDSTPTDKLRLRRHDGDTIVDAEGAPFRTPHGWAQVLRENGGYTLRYKAIPDKWSTLDRDDEETDSTLHENEDRFSLIVEDDGRIRPVDDADEPRRRSSTVTVSLAAKWAGYEYDRDEAGRLSDSAGVLVQPGVLSQGGGDRPDEAYQWFIARAGAGSTEGGDIVVLTTDRFGVDTKYFRDVATAANLALDSVEVLSFNYEVAYADARAAAESDEFIAHKLDHAEAVFITGGDQWEYVNLWHNTQVTNIINARMGAIVLGGTSAGMAVQGDVVFTAENRSNDGTGFTSDEALANPFDIDLALASDFLNVPAYSGLLTETHFAELEDVIEGSTTRARDRMGRAIAFLARLDKDGTGSRVLAADAGAAITIDGKTDQFTVYAQASTPDKPRYPVYFITTDANTTIDRLEDDEPLIITNVLVRRVNPGEYGSFEDLWDMSLEIPGTRVYSLSYDGAAFSSPDATTNDQDEVKYGRPL